MCGSKRLRSQNAFRVEVASLNVNSHARFTTAPTSSRSNASRALLKIQIDKAVKRKLSVSPPSPWGSVQWNFAIQVRIHSSVAAYSISGFIYIPSVNFPGFKDERMSPSRQPPDHSYLTSLRENRPRYSVDTLGRARGFG